MAGGNLGDKGPCRVDNASLSPRRSCRFLEGHPRDPQPESGENAFLSRPRPELPSVSQRCLLLELFVFFSTAFIETSIYFSEGILKDGRGPWRPGNMSQ